MAECTVCVETFNKSTRKPITCPYCPTTICRTCIQYCLLQDNEPRCQNVDCRKGWSDEFLYSVLTKVWLDSAYQDHRGKVIVDREKARMPETQQEAAVYINAKALVDDITPRINAIKTQMEELPIVVEYKQLRDTVYDVNKSRAERDAALVRYHQIQNNKLEKRATMPFRKQINELNSEAYKQALKHVKNYGLTAAVLGRSLEEKKWTFVGMEPVLDGHVCDPDTLLTVRAMRKEAKPCPKCASMISKIDGCDQMWCTQCHTAFSWRTGAEETMVHNPHFYEWMRRTGQTMAPGAVRIGAAGGAAPACGFQGIWNTYIQNAQKALPDHKINVYMHGYYGLQNRTAKEGQMAEKIQNIAMNTNHIHGYCLNTLTEALRYEQLIDNEAKRVLRVRRLANEITDEDWKVPLAKMEKRSKKRHVLRDIYDMYIQTSMGLMNEFNIAIDGAVPFDTACDTLFTQYKELVVYVNEELRKIRNRFTASVTMVPFFA